MWNFGRQKAAVELSKKLMVHLAKERGLTDEAATSLRMMEERGRYVGRRVTFFRVFDPANVDGGGNPRRFSDLDSCKLLYRGHIEGDGQIILSQ